MKPKTRRTLKKVFLNVTAGLFALIFTGNVIAGENAGQINQVLGTKTSETISTLPAGQEEGYARYFESNFSSIAELKAAGEAKVREVEGEGIVLLKNENSTLPLASGSKVSLVGVTVMDPVYGGTGSGAVDADGAPNYYDVLTGAGYEVLDNISLMPEIAIGARAHHERPDGKGYPLGLTQDEIPRVAQIIAVADCFDAMYSNRPYRNRMNFDKVVSIIKEVSGTQLTPDVVDAFLRLVEKGEFRAPDDDGGGSTESIENIRNDKE